MAAGPALLCDAAACPQATFATRLTDLLPVRAQRTTRLTRRLQDFGVALGGEAGARLAAQSQMPLTGDTLLWIIRAVPRCRRTRRHASWGLMTSRCAKAGCMARCWSTSSTIAS